MDILQNKDAVKVGVFITTIDLNLFSEATCSKGWRFHCDETFPCRLAGYSWQKKSVVKIVFVVIVDQYLVTWATCRRAGTTGVE